MKKKTDKEFSIEWQYKQYLERGKMTEEQMHPTQRQETKRAFYGACGQMLIMMRDDVSDIEDVNECIETMQDCLSQVGEFWEREVKKNEK